MESDWFMSGNILGFQPWFVILLGLVLAGGVFFWWQRNQKGKVKASEEKLIYCTFYLHNADRVHYWCKIIDNEIGLSTEERKRLEKVAKAHGHDEKIEKWYKGDLNKVVALDLPVDIEGGKYFIGSEFIYNDDHPEDIKKPLGQRRKIKTCEFVAGIPLPIIGVNLAKWTPEMIREMGTQLIGAGSDVTTLNVLNTRDHGFLDNLALVAKAMSQFGLLKICCIVAAAGGSISAGIGFMVYSLLKSVYGG